MSRGDYDRGILICGTGIGMAIVANKVPGVRAAQCHDVYSAERARKSNDAQIMTMGALVVGTELAKKLVDVWLESEFQGGRVLAKGGKD
nr:RpiB/LacA/LacB family sugar-phosphate isomerase [Biomaibacter acetigenes]